MHAGDHGAGEAAIYIRLDMAAIDALQLHVDATSVKWSIVEHPKLKLKAEHVRVHTIDQVNVETRAAVGGSGNAIVTLCVLDLHG